MTGGEGSTATGSFNADLGLSGREIHSRLTFVFRHLVRGTDYEVNCLTSAIVVNRTLQHCNAVKNDCLIKLEA